MAKKKKDLGECAYCPNPATTKDHVPPKTIFAKRTQNRPWVPACEDCNREASKDDEYIQRLAMLYGAEACNDALDVGERFMRALEHKEAKRLQTSVINSLSPQTPEQEVMFPDGINIALEGDRLTNIMKKIVRGWFFKLKGKRFPTGYEIMTYQPGKGKLNEVLISNEEIIDKVPGFLFGDYAFTFRVAFHPDNDFLSCWRIEFFKVFKVMAYSCLMGEDTFQLLDLRNPYSIPVHPSELVAIHVPFGHPQATPD